MKNIDGSKLGTMKQWRCSGNKNHVLGITERVKEKIEVEGRTIFYFVTRLLIFRTAIDIEADVLEQVEVQGELDIMTMTLDMSWLCTVPGCGCVRKWSADSETIERVVTTYLAE